jgi:hypothetical protein
LKEGFKHFEIRFQWRLHQFLQYPYPRWTGETGKTVFLVSDQGLGDTLSFARFVRETCKRSQYVHCYIQPELMRLFQHAFMDIENINLLPFGANFPAADVWTTFVSLPFALGLSDDEIRNAEQIKPPFYSLPTSWMVPDTKLHVGVQWAGSRLNDVDRHRTISAHHFFDLYRCPGIQLYSLQVGSEHENDANNMGGPALIKPLSPYIRDVVDTVAVLRDLDLVICCESALAHICALANKECWIAYSWLGRDYRIGDGSDILWAPKHRIFRQHKDGDWDPVFREIAKVLEQRVAQMDKAKAA